LGLKHGRMKKLWDPRVKAWLGYQKGCFVIYQVDPSLEHVISKLNGTFILKVSFSSHIHTLLKYYFIHNISNLNEF
jgi:hypothetical protein